MASSQEPNVACLCGIVGFDRVKQQEIGEKLQEQYTKTAQKTYLTLKKLPHQKHKDFSLSTKDSPT